MSISDRLDQIEQRCETATPAQAETSLGMDGFNMHEDYPEYGQGQLMNAYMLGYDEGCADKSALLAAVRAVLAIDTGDNRNVYGLDFEAGMVKALRIVHQTITAALGCGDGIDTTPERVDETGKSEHIGEGRNGQ